MAKKVKKPKKSAVRGKKAAKRKTIAAKVKRKGRAVKSIAKKAVKKAKKTTAHKKAAKSGSTSTRRRVIRAVSGRATASTPTFTEAEPVKQVVNAAPEPTFSSPRRTPGR